MKSVNILNIEVGNLYSIEKAIKKIGYSPKIINKIDKIRKDQPYIIPGVGGFHAAMISIKKKSLLDPIKNMISQNVKILGICVGMQLFSRSSNEHKVTKGIGYLNTKVTRLKETKKANVPHVGFNNVKIMNCKKLFKNIPDESDFYFDHSYKMNIPNNKDFDFAITNHDQEFITAFQKKNIYGVQFHPEKSKQNGLQLLKNFLEM